MPRLVRSMAARPDRRVGMGEGPGLQRGVAVVAHGEPVECEAEAGRPGDDPCPFRSLQMIGIVQIDGREAAHGGGALDELDEA